MIFNKQCPECEGYRMTEVNGTTRCPNCNGKGRIKSTNHWYKLDHITFLLMLPFLLLVIINIWFIVGAITLWTIALIYDLYEHKIEEEK